MARPHTATAPGVRGAASKAARARARALGMGLCLLPDCNQFPNELEATPCLLSGTRPKEGHGLKGRGRTPLLRLEFIPAPTHRHGTGALAHHPDGYGTPLLLCISLSSRPPSLPFPVIASQPAVESCRQVP